MSHLAPYRIGATAAGLRLIPGCGTCLEDGTVTAMTWAPDRHDERLQITFRDGEQRTYFGDGIADYCTPRTPVAPAELAPFTRPVDAALERLRRSGYKLTVYRGQRGTVGVAFDKNHADGKSATFGEVYISGRSGKFIRGSVSGLHNRQLTPSRLLMTLADVRALAA